MEGYETISKKDRYYAAEGLENFLRLRVESVSSYLDYFRGNICMKYIGCGEEHFAREVGAVVKYSAHGVNETDTSLKIAESARDILQMAPKPHGSTLRRATFYRRRSSLITG